MQDIALASQDQARTLTDRIKVAVEGTWLLIQEAYTSRAWAALGYSTWDAYCTAEFGETRLRLPREERQEVVASLRESGLSVRAIAAATGSSVGTIAGEVGRCSEMNTSAVIGVDGKTYAAARPAPEPADGPDLLAGDEWVQPDGPGFEAATPSPVAPKPKRRPLPEAFTDASHDFTRAAERLARLTEDDRFPKNRDASHHQLPELLGALDNTTRLITAMNLPAAEASEEARRWWATSLHNLSDALTGIANSLEKEQS